MKKVLAYAAAAGLATLGLPAAASASTWIGGDNITCTTNTHPNSRCNGLPTATASVGSGVEFDIFAVPAFNPLLTIDFASNGLLTISSLGDRTITSTVLTFTNNTKLFTGVTAVAAGNLANRVSVTNGVLTLNLAGVNFDPGQVTTFQVSAVPEPGTWMLMILGLGAVGFSMRRRQTSTARLQFA